MTKKNTKCQQKILRVSTVELLPEPGAAVLQVFKSGVSDYNIKRTFAHKF